MPIIQVPLPLNIPPGAFISDPFHKKGADIGYHIICLGHHESKYKAPPPSLHPPPLAKIRERKICEPSCYNVLVASPSIAHNIHVQGSCTIITWNYHPLFVALPNMNGVGEETTRQLNKNMVLYPLFNIM
jgi:hypothetical protein